MSASVVATASFIRDRNSSRPAGGGGTKTLSLTYPHREKSRCVKSGNHGGQAFVFLCPGFLSSSARVECHLAVWMKM